MSFTLPTKEEKAEYVLKQFDRIAQKYDLTNDLISLGMHRLWKSAAISRLVKNGAGTYLDVCCGTGDLTMLVADRLSAQGKVVGLDFSPKMLEVARSRWARNQGRYQNKFEFVEADAQNLPFDDNSFDGATLSFGLRNLTDFQRGISEMARVVKPGGLVVNLDLGRTTVPGFAQLFSFYFGHIVPLIGEVIQSDRQAYTYLPQSLSTYPTPDGIAKLFANAGLTEIEYIPMALGSVAFHSGKVASANQSI